MKSIKSSLFSIIALLAMTGFLFTACESPSDEDETFTVTFDTDGGTAVASIPDVASGATVTLPKDPTKAGYTFEGWFTAKDGGGTAFTDKTEVTADITVYAYWKLIPPGQFSVTFDVGTGPVTNAPKQTTVEEGKLIDRPTTDPSKTGYAFVDWYKEATYKTVWDFDNDTVTANTILFAKWIETFRVTFDSKGGSKVDGSPFDIASGATVSRPTTDPTKTGNEFGGWYKEATYKTEWNFDTDTVAAPVTLHAKWTPSKVIITATESVGTDAVKAVYVLTITELGGGEKITISNVGTSSVSYTFNPAKPELEDQGKAIADVIKKAPGAKYDVEVTYDEITLTAKTGGPITAAPEATVTRAAGLTGSGTVTPTTAGTAGTLAVYTIVVGTVFDAGQTLIITGAKAAPVTYTNAGTVLADATAEADAIVTAIGTESSNLYTASATTGTITLTAKDAGAPKITISGTGASKATLANPTPAVAPAKAVYSLAITKPLVGGESFSIANVASESIEYPFDNSKATAALQAKAILDLIAEQGDNALYTAKASGATITLTAKEGGIITTGPTITPSVTTDIYGAGDVVGPDPEGTGAIKAEYILTINAALVEGETLVIENLAKAGTFEYSPAAGINEADKQAKLISTAMKTFAGVLYTAAASGSEITLTAKSGGVISDAPIVTISR